ncbi:hypothetical protein CP532_5477 [Ophiocordyceps camponoti-leonardi (nom. inval.)]|nr:hypothetical protein CP532_5477 [Ophiocordyceps camponoti-leonardi (nom. inval.)]
MCACPYAVETLSKNSKLYNLNLVAVSLFESTKDDMRRVFESCLILISLKELLTPWSEAEQSYYNGAELRGRKPRVGPALSASPMR